MGTGMPASGHRGLLSTGPSLRRHTRFPDPSLSLRFDLTTKPTLRFDLPFRIQLCTLNTTFLRKKLETGGAWQSLALGGNEFMGGGVAAAAAAAAVRK